MAAIKHTIQINTDASTVYKSLIKKKGIQGWWTHEVHISPEVGSTAEFWFGGKYHNKMIIHNLQPNKRVEWVCRYGDSEWVDTHIIFNINEKEGITTLSFTHGNWRDKTDFFETCNLHWGQYMKSIKDYCETGKGHPYSPK